MGTSTAQPIPFNRSTVAPHQIDYVTASFLSEKISGDGPFTERATQAMAQLMGTDRVLLTPSCTAALEMCALLLDIGPGDEVIVPSFTFVSTANAFALFGATIVFADVDPVDFNIDPSQVEALFTDRTKAVVAVHYGGVPAEVERLAALCDQHGATLIEDAAHAMFATHDGRALGTVGALSTFSFHETKNVSCGEGGALVVNDPELWDRARIVREKGTDRSRFLEGLVDKYTWVDRGSSYLLADPLAAVLLAQLEFGATIQQRRRDAVERYRSGLARWTDDHDVVLPPAAKVPGESAAHLFALLLPDRAERDRFLAHTREHGVASVFHYLPLHDSPCGERYGDRPCPVTTDVSARIARLPLYSDITPDEADRVVEVVTSFEVRR